MGLTKFVQFCVEKWEKNPPTEVKSQTGKGLVKRTSFHLQGIIPVRIVFPKLQILDNTKYKSKTLTK